jgi:hypothetical protein
MFVANEEKGGLCVASRAWPMRFSIWVLLAVCSTHSPATVLLYIGRIFLASMALGLPGAEPTVAGVRVRPLGPQHALPAQVTRHQLRGAEANELGALISQREKVTLAQGKRAHLWLIRTSLSYWRFMSLQLSILASIVIS